jgi:glycosyltransferase involved in cell wall biosynthesis
MSTSSPTITFCLEQALGHRAHGQNLEAALQRHPCQSRVIRVEQPQRERVRVPWAVRGSAGAYKALRDARPSGPVFFHTQTISLFAPAAVRGRPYVVSVDATPVQVDAMGEWYQHRQGPRYIEAPKRTWYRTVLKRATAVVAWSEWASKSLQDDYGVPAAKILVAHPGASTAVFNLPREDDPGTLRILFVGGNFVRKGGDTLLAAFRSIRRPGLELVLVTEADVPVEPGVRVERGIAPGSERLLREYARADIFCLPTLGDCTPVAVEEAMAAGLPVLTTPVGANAETVVHGETGLLVPVSDEQGLADALRSIVDDRLERQRMGAAARERARRLLSAEENAFRIMDLMVSLA